MTGKMRTKQMEQDAVKEYGMVMNEGILTLSIIGEIEGHDCLSQNAKTTKYEHILPILARAEQDENVKGILFLMNTVGGDVSCGLALAEMVHSLSMPTVSFSHWRQSFDSCSTYRSGRLFFYCSVGDDDYPPGSDEWHGTGNAADISAVSTDSGSNYLFRGRA